MGMTNDEFWKIHDILVKREQELQKDAELYLKRKLREKSQKHPTRP